jgi:hypothetical protein
MIICISEFSYMPHLTSAFDFSNPNKREASMVEGWQNERQLVFQMGEALRKDCLMAISKELNYRNIENQLISYRSFVIEDTDTTSIPKK